MVSKETSIERARMLSNPSLLNVNPRALIESLGFSYRVRDALAVQGYLAQRPDVVSILHEAAPAIRAVFGPDTPLVLDVPPDDDDEGTRRLYIRIQIGLGVAEALHREDLFHEQWVWPHASVIPPDTHFSVEFVR
ncbi:MAG: hypothetical protein ACRDJH_17535 [Thermomicrobiales bacterium]